MLIAKKAKFAMLAITVLVSALVFPRNTWAAAGSQISCQPSSSCTVGEYLFDDSYNPLTTATCTIASHNPDNSIFLNNVALTSTADAWYANTFTAPATLGLYPTVITCVTGANTMRIDKSFTVANASALSQTDIASAVWGYTNRTLSSFGSVVSDIWNNSSRTLTAKGLADGTSLATQNDVKSNSTNATLQTIDKTSQQNRLLLEQIVNKPIIQTSIQEDNTNLQSKIDDTKKVVDQLKANTLYIQSKSSLLSAKWYTMDEKQIKSNLDKLSSLVGTEKDQSKDNIFGQIASINDAWGWQNLQSSLTTTRNIQRAISAAQNEFRSYGKSQTALSNIKSITAYATELNSVLGNVSDVDTQKTIIGQLNVVVKLASTIDTSKKNIDSILNNFQSNTISDIKSKISTLASQIFSINKIPQATTVLASINQQTNSLKNLKNQLLSMRGILDANKKFLAKKPNSPLAFTWLEEGSIVFKTLVTNPSTLISQEVPIEFLLPPEIKKENIIKVDDGLTVTYDMVKDQLIVTGKIILEPGQSKTISVSSQDIFVISDSEIITLKKQTVDLVKTLEKTHVFAQAVSLQNDINTSLDKIMQLQKGNTTPEEKIRSYREEQIELKNAKDKIEKIKDLNSLAGQSTNLMGFVGGAQIFAVWGLVIVIVSGFVFLALYMKTLSRREEILEAKIEHEPQNLKVKTPKGKPLEPSLPTTGFNYRFAVIIAALLIVAASGIIAGKHFLFQGKTGQNKAINQNQKLPNQQTVLGTKNGQNGANTDATLPTIKIFVPPQSVVAIYSEADTNSPTIASLDKTQNVKKLQDGTMFVKVRTDANQEGWIDKDFVETITSSNTDTTVLATITDTPTGFLRVREKPSGKETNQVKPGEKYPITAEDNGWIQIKLPDDTLGWISKQYTSQN